MICPLSCTELDWKRFLMRYFCFSNHDELLTSGAKIEKLIVSHPALSQPTDIQILYIAYEGWIYSGRLVLVRMTLLVFHN